jgi:predicted component of type VI protein secretion system
MDKCPVCGADTRPGDNYCLNCGQRLLPNTPSPLPMQQAQPAMSEAAPDYQEQGIMGTVPAGSSWGANDSNAPTVAAPSSELPTVRESMSAPTAQATLDRIEHPARFLLRAESGETLQEYLLDKAEMVIGRAPTSDVLLSKDKLTSRRHATVRYENSQYYLYDEHSANGTFVNGQQIEDTGPYLLHDGDHVGIGEHELVFHSYQTSAVNIEDLPTRSVPFSIPQPDLTYRTRDDSLATIPGTDDDYGTRSMDGQKEKEEPVVPSPMVNPVNAVVEEPPAEPTYQVQPAEPTYHVQPAEPTYRVQPAEPTHVAPATTASVPDESPVPEPSKGQPIAPAQAQSTSSVTDGTMNFGRLTNLPQPALPDISALMAALSKLDGEITSLQEQFNTTQEAMRNRDGEIARNANELRNAIRQVADRMNDTIADVARSREALAWTDLLQLMEDVMNNPRDIEYVTKLARKARELNKIIQIHQNVLQTMAECHSLLRNMIGTQEVHS